MIFTKQINADITQYPKILLQEITFMKTTSNF